MRYRFESLNVKDLQDAKTKIQGFIDYNQCSLLVIHRETLIDKYGSIEQVDIPDGIGISGDILLPEGVEASKLNYEFVYCLAPISIQAVNYLAKIICETIEEDVSYENLIMSFYDPEDITEISFPSNNGFDECFRDDVQYREISGCWVIENQMYGICFIELLLMQVAIGVKVNAHDEIIEIMYMRSNILGT